MCLRKLVLVLQVTGVPPGTRSKQRKEAVRWQGLF